MKRKKKSKEETLMADGYPVVDAKSDVTIFVIPIDIKGAVRKDPSQCAIARAIQRIVGNKNAEAQILRGCAYVKGPQENGEIAWLRYRVSKTTRERIERFDKTGKADVGGYVLKAPTASQTLEAKRQRLKSWINKPNGKKRRIMMGKMLKFKDTVRSGGGLVHTMIIR